MQAMRGASQRAPVLSAPAVLTRVIVLATLAAFIGLAYLAIPVGLGTLLGTGPSTALSVAATVVVALGFAVCAAWAERTAQLLVYGARSTPYEVLTELSDRMAGAYPTTDVLLHMAQILGSGSGAATSACWLRVGDELVPAGVLARRRVGDAALDAIYRQRAATAAGYSPRAGRTSPRRIDRRDHRAGAPGQPTLACGPAIVERLRIASRPRVAERSAHRRAR